MAVEATSSRKPAQHSRRVMRAQAFDGLRSNQSKQLRDTSSARLRASSALPLALRKFRGIQEFGALLVRCRFLAMTFQSLPRSAALTEFNIDLLPSRAAEPIG